MSKCVTTAIVLFGILSMGVLFSCKTKQSAKEMIVDKSLSCSTPRSLDAKGRYPRIVVYFDAVQVDSIAQGMATTFYFPSDSSTSNFNLQKFISENIKYPEMLIEMDIQGRWIYQLKFVQDVFVGYSLLRPVPDGRLMEKEIERVLNKLVQKLSFSPGGNGQMVIMIEGKLVE